MIRIYNGHKEVLTVRYVERSVRCLPLRRLSNSIRRAMSSALTANISSGIGFSCEVIC